MKTVGIIAEYNPFHNGHAYLISEAKRLTGADYVVVVMSGDFVQRGAPAVWDKYLRTRAALMGGADIIFELPVCFATSSAENFATGAIALLSSLGIESLCFGSESGNIDDIKLAAEALLNESDVFKDELNYWLRQGMPYAYAANMGLKAHCRIHGLPASVASLMSSPNNLLGIEYCKALLSLGSNMNPFTIKRIESSHHDVVTNGQYSSSTSIRTIVEQKGAKNINQKASQEAQKLLSQNQLNLLPKDVKENMSKVSENWFQTMQQESPKAFSEILYRLLKPTVPKEVGELYRKTILGLPYLTENDFSTLLYYQLLFETAESLSSYADWNIETANRMLARLNPEDNFEMTAKGLKGKQLTYTRTSRMLLHVLLRLQEDSLRKAKAHGSAFYARLLGIRSSSSEILRIIAKNSSVPIINRLAPAVKKMEGLPLELLMQDIHAAELYRMVQQNNAKKDLLFPSEYHRGIVRI